MEEPKNICDFKKVCKECQFATLEERPGKCITLVCPDYKPCIMCGRNNYVNERQLCVKCQNNKARQKAEARRKEYLAQLEKTKQLVANQLEPELQRQIPQPEALSQTNAHQQPELKYSITHPGTPPPEMNEEERKFYIERWEQYKGYYHNPAAEFAVHQIIQEEVYISRLTTMSYRMRGEKAEDNVKARETSYRMLSMLKSQLPEKEADELSDHDKSMSVIYDKYVEEKRKRYHGGVSRMLSPDAIALAPNLIHPINPRDILVRMGFGLTSLEDVIEKYETISAKEISELTPERVEEILRFFGFRLKEQYAMDYKTLDFETDTVLE